MTVFWSVFGAAIAFLFFWYEIRSRRKGSWQRHEQETLERYGEEVNSRVTSRCCGADCMYDDDQDEKGQCWGKVEVDGEIETGDDYVWIHSCEGHRGMWDDPKRAKYKPENLLLEEHIGAQWNEADRELEDDE